MRAESTPTRSSTRRAWRSCAAEFTRIRTTSPGTSLRTISPDTHGIGANLPGQSPALCGHPIQVAWCGSHSAGMRKPRAAGEALSAIGCQQSASTGILLTADGWRRIIEEPAAEAFVRIYAPISQERPPPAHLLDAPEVDLPDQDRLPILRRLGDDRPKRIGEERRAPEVDPVSPSRSLVAHPVHGRDVTAVGDRVASLDRSPGVELLGTVRGLLLGMPADRRGIEQDAGTLQRREACAFGIPLVPAHQRSNPSDPRVERAETQVARGEVELLVIRGIVGDVHLTVDPYHTAVGVDH